jgi:hypothetical protein
MRILSAMPISFPTFTFTLSEPEMIPDFRPVDILFPEERARKEMALCPFCDNAISESDFRDKVSLREYQISGLCQSCQDEVFSGEEY